jgi:hypothetical protein
VSKITAAVTACLAAAVIVLSIGFVRTKSVAPQAPDPPTFNTPFQAVLLDSGMVYYGKLSRLGTQYPLMTDVYYIVRTEDPKTKQVHSVLVKRGKELHAPTETYLNARHIVLIENVGENSQVAKLIADSQSRPANAPSNPSQQ